jgi:hypothetical protein
LRVGLKGYSRMTTPTFTIAIHCSSLLLSLLFEKAVALLNNGEGIFAWAPSLREWLKDADYVFWLGAGGLRISG